MKVEFAIVYLREIPNTRALLLFASGVAMVRGLNVVSSEHWVSVDVDDFPQWLSCMYCAFVEFSRGSFPDAMRFRYPFLVHCDGMVYRTHVWFDEQIRGLRYGLAV